MRYMRYIIYILAIRSISSWERQWSQLLSAGKIYWFHFEANLRVTASTRWNYILMVDHHRHKWIMWVSRGALLVEDWDCGLKELILAFDAWIIGPVTIIGHAISHSPLYIDISALETHNFRSSPCLLFEQMAISGVFFYNNGSWHGN
jgi:hypothetical protein